MPKKEIDYSKTLIYKIVCRDLNIRDVYIGHTTDFRARKANHKATLKNENNKDYNLYIYKCMRENGGWNNWDMIEVEKYPCNDGNEARERERYWYELNNSTLNTKCPNRSIIEYREQNIERYRESWKKYYNDNKEQINAYRKTRITCPCGSICNKDKIKRHEQSMKHQLYINSI
jgi:hypothetical protein